jgi:hypothetical protein
VTRSATGLARRRALGAVLLALASLAAPSAALAHGILR